MTDRFHPQEVVRRAATEAIARCSTRLVESLDPRGNQDWVRQLRALHHADELDLGPLVAARSQNLFRSPGYQIAEAVAGFRKLVAEVAEMDEQLADTVCTEYLRLLVTEAGGNRRANSPAADRPGTSTKRLQMYLHKNVTFPPTTTPPLTGERLVELAEAYILLAQFRLLEDADLSTVVWEATLEHLAQLLDPHFTLDALADVHDEVAVGDDPVGYVAGAALALEELIHKVHHDQCSVACQQVVSFFIADLLVSYVGAARRTATPLPHERLYCRQNPDLLRKLILQSWVLPDRAKVKRALTNEGIDVEVPRSTAFPAHTELMLSVVDELNDESDRNASRWRPMRRRFARRVHLAIKRVLRRGTHQHSQRPSRWAMLRRSARSRRARDVRAHEWARLEELVARYLARERANHRTITELAALLDSSKGSGAGPGYRREPSPTP